MKITNKENIAAPVFLVEEDTYAQGCERVTHFLDKSALVTYENISFTPDHSCSASDDMFWAMVDKGLEKNRQSVIGLINELQESGYSTLTELAAMEQGYESKILHTLVHLLDGFIGIDSAFYNLIEDSHLLSTSLRRKIKQRPKHYQLIQINASNLWSFL
ncbi:MAG: hypothetical protein K9K37_09255 [Desulfocapsa sp.]|nr:hypothetical protein [Desulfocapsa sp.]